MYWLGLLLWIKYFLTAHRCSDIVVTIQANWRLPFIVRVRLLFTVGFCLVPDREVNQEPGRNVENVFKENWCTALAYYCCIIVSSNINIGWTSKWLQAIHKHQFNGHFVGTAGLVHFLFNPDLWLVPLLLLPPALHTDALVTHHSKNIISQFCRLYLLLWPLNSLVKCGFVLCSIVCVCVYCFCCFCVVCFFWVFFTFVAFFPSVLWYCWLVGLLACKTVSKITYTMSVETLNHA